VTGAGGVVRPSTVIDAARALHGRVGAVALAGGTDLVPALRAGAAPEPSLIVALRGVRELRVRGRSSDRLIVGAGVTYAELASWPAAPGLATTARVVGSTQIRNAGTVGGAIGTANPRGDLLTFLVAAGADLLLADGVRRWRTPLVDHLAARRLPRPDDAAGPALVTAVVLPRPAGPQTYLKIGLRQAAAPPVLGCGLVVDRGRGRLGAAVGGVAAVPVRTAAACRFAESEIDWSAPAIAPDALRRFGELVGDAVADVPVPLPPLPAAPAPYLRHAAGVLATRALARCLAAAASDADADADAAAAADADADADADAADAAADAADGSADPGPNDGSGLG
jgi:CO/xanthine dehydrogenase FAD-binding subunit